MKIFNKKNNNFWFSILNFLISKTFSKDDKNAHVFYQIKNEKSNTINSVRVLEISRVPYGTSLILATRSSLPLFAHTTVLLAVATILVLPSLSFPLSLFIATVLLGIPSPSLSIIEKNSSPNFQFKCSSIWPLLFGLAEMHQVSSLLTLS